MLTLYEYTLCLLGMLVLRTAVHSYVLNNDPAYTRWPNGRIPFYLNPVDYSEAEVRLIQVAMQTFSANMGGCIQFQQLASLPTPGTMNHVLISKAGGPGTPSPTCFTYPGMIAGPLGLQGQHMSIQGGTSGCMSSVKAIMRLLASLAGLRSEHNKPVRQSFVQVNPSNVESRTQPYVPLNTYDQSKVYSDTNDFDYNSITLIDPLAYSGNGGPVIQSFGKAFLNNGQLSRKDCQALAYYYQGTCNPQTCADPYNAGGLTQVPQFAQQVNNGQNLINQNPFQQPINQLPINNQPINQIPINQQPVINNQLPLIPSNVQPAINNGPQTPNLVPPNGAQNPVIPVQPINIPINNNPQNPNNPFNNNINPSNPFNNNINPNNPFNNNINPSNPFNNNVNPANPFNNNVNPTNPFNNNVNPTNPFNNNVNPSNPFNNNVNPSNPFNTPTNNNNLFPNDPNFPNNNNNNNNIFPNNPSNPFNNNNLFPNNPSNPFPNNNVNPINNNGQLPLNTGDFG